jgi:serine/threonine-protein kinase
MLAPAMGAPPPAAPGSPATAAGMQSCPACNAENRVGAKFCSKCGKTIAVSPKPGTGNLGQGTLLADRFLIQKTIARGGMGAVYLVYDMHLKDPALQRDKPWALKEMSESSVPPDQLHDAIKMFQREAAMLAHLDHPSLPRVIDCFEYDAKHYLVMDFIEGDTLDALLRQRSAPFNLNEVVNWARQLMGVIKYLHQQNPLIIYRDIKPGNIMRNAYNHLKLIDFGIARFKRTTTTLNGSVQDAASGTQGYAPPEQWRSGEVTPAADVYALGVTIHQLLTHYDPTTSPTAFRLPLASDIHPAVPRQVAEMLNRAIDPNPQTRLQTIHDFEREFENALTQSRRAAPVSP